MDIIEVIDDARPGDRLELVFIDKTYDGDLEGRLMHILAMDSQSISFGMMSGMNLWAVAQSGKWSGFLTYTITVLEEFDSGYFAKRTADMLESISLVQ